MPVTHIHITLLLCCLFGVTVPASAQLAPSVLSARSLGMGDVGVTMEGIDAAYFNPAALPDLARWGVQANVSRRFGLNELSQENLAFAAPLMGHSAVYGVLRRYGFSAFREQVIGVGYARKLSDGLSLALQFDAHSFSIEGYGNTLVPGYKISLQQQVLSELRLGFHTANPVPAETHDEIELPSELSLGAAYAPSESVTVYAEVQKESTFDPAFKIGVEYQMAPAFCLRLGGSTAPGRIHAGVGYRFPQGLQIDLGGSYHALLGVTPAIGISLTQAQDGSDDRLLDR